MDFQNMENNLFDLQDIVFRVNKNDMIKKDEYEFISNKAIEAKINEYALYRAIEKLPEAVREGVLADMENIRKEYVFRNISKAHQEKLKEYGYEQPMVLLSKKEAYQFMQEGLPVYLLYQNNTEKEARIPIDIQYHNDQKGLIGVPPFIIEEMDFICECREIEKDLDMY